MDDDTERVAPRRRPGGRAAHVRAAVHQAVLDAVIEGGVDKIGIPDIARRAGVQDSTVYRRWGTRENLVLDAMLAASEDTLPRPDTGSLRGDLTALASTLSSYLISPLGRGLVRALAFVTDSPEIKEARNTFWHKRFEANQVMIRQAIARGEISADAEAHARTAIELLIAPIHFRHLLTRLPCDAEFIDTVVAAAIGSLRSTTTTDGERS
ncbi:TetR/AcrR family transcriptional regulator [Rhodococcoides navarretei]|uniref:TetR/AcrR family transcriptional regulator n=1 Tax=Rhodococcus navarretei TaxID=3128981 RepID=A0ABU9CTT9_9NOCA